MTANLVLLASYPKSGNTWLRLVLDKLRREPDSPVALNSMPIGFHGHGRRLLFDSISLANSSDLLPAEIDRQLPEIFRRFDAECPGIFFMKVHDCAFRNPDGQWLFPPECIRAVLYLVRHPFDVAVSAVHHFGVPVEQCVAIMGSANRFVSVATSRLSLPLQVHFDSWSANVKSWTSNSPYRVAVARYEDLCGQPEVEFGRLAAAAGIAFTQTELERAVEATQFSRLQAEERSQGFREKPSTSAAFFRAGQPRSWDGELSIELREQLCRDHGEVMCAFGYEADGSVLPMPGRSAAVA